MQTRHASWYTEALQQPTSHWRGLLHKPPPRGAAAADRLDAIVHGMSRAPSSSETAADVHAAVKLAAEHIEGAHRGAAAELLLCATRACAWAMCPRAMRAALKVALLGLGGSSARASAPAPARLGARARLCTFTERRRVAHDVVASGRPAAMLLRVIRRCYTFAAPALDFEEAAALARPLLQNGSTAEKVEALAMLDAAYGGTERFCGVSTFDHTLEVAFQAALQHLIAAPGIGKGVGWVPAAHIAERALQLRPRALSEAAMQVVLLLFEQAHECTDDEDLAALHALARLRKTACAQIRDWGPLLLKRARAGDLVSSCVLAYCHQSETRTFVVDALLRHVETPRGRRAVLFMAAENHVSFRAHRVKMPVPCAETFAHRRAFIVAIDDAYADLEVRTPGPDGETVCKVHKLVLQTSQLTSHFQTSWPLPDKVLTLSPDMCPGSARVVFEYLYTGTFAVPRDVTEQQVLTIYHTARYFSCEPLMANCARHFMRRLQNDEASMLSAAALREVCDLTFLPYDAPAWRHGEVLDMRLIRDLLFRKPHTWPNGTTAAARQRAAATLRKLLVGVDDTT